MTGDSERTASVIAKKVGVDEYYAEVLPEDKAAFVEKEKDKGRKVIMIGDRIQDIERLVGALQDIKRLYSRDRTGLLSGEYINPEVAVSPQKAFYAEKKSLSIKDSVGCISGEFVMCYPPGIPILAPGERITKEIAEYILYAKEKGCSMQGTEDPAVEYLQVLA
mgnify:CR=1 FL=1